MGTLESDEVSCQGLADAIQERIQRSPQYSQRRCIYRVPSLLRGTNEREYTRLIVSIGPFHHSDPRLHPMEGHKLKYLQSFLRDSKMNADLNSYLRIVKSMEAEIRECYTDFIHLSSDEFTQMVFIDSVFIIEFFRKLYDYPSNSVDDYICGRPGIIDEVFRDITLEENQLPLFILKKLYETAFSPNTNNAVPYFIDIVCNGLDVKKIKVNTNEVKYLHLLDLLRRHYKPTICMLRTDEDHIAINIYESLVCPTVTTLYEAGVNFQVLNSGDSSTLLDIQFDAAKGILTIPRLTMEDSTENLFRSIIAFEQCHYRPQHHYFTDYHMFMNWLIKTPEDVRLLVKAKIIVNCLGSDKEVADLFNSFVQHVTSSTRHYNYMGITQQLISHCGKRRNRYRTILKHTYFRHPWAVVSVIYAAILLLLTLIQVVVGIMAIPNVIKRT